MDTRPALDPELAQRARDASRQLPAKKIVPCPLWREQLAGIKAMRASHDAPVDSMGAEVRTTCVTCMIVLHTPAHATPRITATPCLM